MRPASLSLPGSLYRAPALGARLQERAAEVEVDLERGERTPLHLHPAYEEGFRVLAGRVRVQMGSRTFTLGTGESARALAGVPHRLENPFREPVRLALRLPPALQGRTEEVKTLLVFSPGGDPYHQLLEQEGLLLPLGRWARLRLWLGL